MPVVMEWDAFRTITSSFAVRGAWAILSIVEFEVVQSIPFHSGETYQITAKYMESLSE